VFGGGGAGKDDGPSTIPRPDLRMGTRERSSGWTVFVVYSKPMGVSSCRL
jgi:hypothetical protein